MRYLVDTDWIVHYLKGRSPAVSLLPDLFPEGLAISIITFAEVYEGIYYGTNPKQNEAIFRKFLRGVRLLGISQSIARQFARVRGKLRTEGEIISQPDIFIAATAIQHDLTLVTGNHKHFKRIPNLKLYQSQ